MNTTVRPLTTAGLAITLAAASAYVAPLAVRTADVPLSQNREVVLTAGDISWDQVLQTAVANATDIYDHFSPAAFADLQQFAANIPAYLEGTRSFDTDLSLAYTAATTPFVPTDPEPYIYTSLDPTPSSVTVETLLGDIGIPLAGKEGLLDVLANGLPYSIGICPGVACLEGNVDVLSLLVGADDAAQIQPYLEFSGSPLSGILWGSFGTTVGPLLQLNDDIADVTAALSGSTPDYTTAFNELLDMPANMSNAFLNGYGEINLGTLLTTFGLSAPSDLDAEAINVSLGGLLSPAGSLIDGIGLTESIGECSLLCVSLDVPSSLVGPIASLFMQDQAIAEAVGWDGVGQPLAQLFSDLAGMLD